MTNKQIYILYGEASNYSDPDAFASDAALSILDPDDTFQEVDVSIANQMSILWKIANYSFRDFLSLIGMTQTQCSIRFCIPLRTVQGWTLGERKAPPYIRLMMAELSGAIELRNK